MLTGITRKFKRLRSLPPAILLAKGRAFAAGYLFGRIYLDLNHDMSQSLMVAGIHRSGSTWLADLINDQLHYRLTFEPIRDTKDAVMAAFDKRYVRPKEESDYLRQGFEKLLKGTLRDYHLNRKNRRLFCRGRLLKTVSASLLLKWFREEFPSVPIVYIIRNPFLAVTSFQKLHWVPPLEPEFWLGQEALMEDHLQPHRRLLLNTKTDIEKYVLEWCILNFVPLKQFRSGEWHLVFYDDLVRNPERELEAIFDYLNAPDTNVALKKVAVPSHTSEEDVKDREWILEKWKTSLSSQEQKTVERYVREFGLGRYLEGSSDGLAGKEAAKSAGTTR